MRIRKNVWNRSSFCVQGECAEIARIDGMIVLRSSSAPRRAVRYTPEEFRALRLGIQAGEFDDLEEQQEVGIKERGYEVV